ncbi:Uma2 family endonuclease [Streptomyces sp. NPDC102365]|uniref:Uma2 family endonuclease n=1 Tax=Streptomyces sp. NPDC102365 TaxID=3366162 RepID=UPI00380D63BD
MRAGASAETKEPMPGSVVEVVSPSGVRSDYEVKPRWYASRGIANHLVVDPLQGHCATMWNPGSDGYRGRDVVP